MVEPSKRWEYHVEAQMLLPVERLNELGAAGWELIAVEDDDD